MSDQNVKCYLVDFMRGTSRCWTTVIDEHNHDYDGIVKFARGLYKLGPEWKIHVLEITKKQRDELKQEKKDFCNWLTDVPVTQ